MVAPLALRRYVSVQLLNLRKEAGLTREAMAKEMGCSLGHVRHLETLQRLPRALETRALLTRYGAEDRIDSFLSLVEAAKRGKDWWADLPGVPSWLELLLAFESAAAEIRSYDTMIVPGLFQTPAYNKMVIRTGEPELPDEEVQHRLDLRTSRQDVLTRKPDAPAVWRLLDESVLYRGERQPDVLAEQLEHLIKLAELPNVHLQVVPRTAFTAGMNGTFTMLTFGPEFEGDPGVAYTESRIKGSYYETAADILRYRDTWSRVQLDAHGPEESRAVIARRIEELTA